MIGHHPSLADPVRRPRPVWLRRLSVLWPRVVAMSTTSPAESLSTPVDGVDVLGALSPSRASDFMTCPLL